MTNKNKMWIGVVWDCGKFSTFVVEIALYFLCGMVSKPLFWMSIILQ